MFIYSSISRGSFFLKSSLSRPIHGPRLLCCSRVLHKGSLLGLRRGTKSFVGLSTCHMSRLGHNDGCPLIMSVTRRQTSRGGREGTVMAVCRRWSSSTGDKQHRRSDSSHYYYYWKTVNRSTALYMVALTVVVVGLSYAAVPLYRLFCQASGYGGTTVQSEGGDKVEKMEPVPERELTVRFNADTSAAMQWKFKPHQREIKVVPGETALAFYTAHNPTDRAVTGIATYNVIPFEAGQYFNKIQCFCFEEQRLNPHEEVDMPVFFYIDPEFDEDPALIRVNTLTLSYTFFESKDGDFEIPKPS